ncbi:MAG: hypothetical protein H7239_09385 [Flavobacterium sp.]|nr:hypothetical protein [Flavobacterium sp.]
MKKQIVFFLFFTINFSYCQEQKNIFEKLPNNIDNLSELNINDSIIKIYITDIIQIKTLIQKSKKKYKVIYFFSPSCHSCMETFPEISKYLIEKEKYFDFFIVSGHRYTNVPLINKYLSSQFYYRPVFIIDTEKYGNKSNPFKRLDLVTQEMCPKCDYEKMGFSAYFVLDENSEIILNTNWENENIEKITKLKSIPID